MANLTESPIYEPGIFQLEKSTPPLGGAPVIDNGVPSAGHANAQAQQLANRTANHQVRLTQAEADIVSLQGEAADLDTRVDTIEAELAGGGSASVLAADLANNTDPAKGAALTGYDGTTVAEQISQSRKLPNYAALRAYTGNAQRFEITQAGISGVFSKSAFTSGDVDDGGITILSSGGSWTYRRQFSGVVTPFWFGVTNDGVTNFTNQVRAMHTTANNLKNVFVDYHGLTSLCITAGAFITVNTDTDFAGCVMKAQNGIITDPTYQTRTMFFVNDPSILPQTLTLSVSELFKGATQVTVPESIGNGFLLIDSNLPVGNRTSDPTTNLFFLQPFSIERGGVLNKPLGADLTTSTITATFRADPDRWIEVSGICADETLYNNECLLKVNRNLTKCSKFMVKPSGVNTQPNNVNYLFQATLCSNVIFEDWRVSAQTSTGLTTSTYGITADKVAELTYSRLTGKGKNTWGITLTDHVNGWYIIDCHMNRFDVHMGMHNTYVRGGSLYDYGVRYGWGSGDLQVDGTSFYGNLTVVAARVDYDGNFFGNISVKNIQVKYGKQVAAASGVAEVNSIYAGTSLGGRVATMMCESLEIRNVCVDYEGSAEILLVRPILSDLVTGNTTVKMPNNIIIDNIYSNKGRIVFSFGFPMEKFTAPSGGKCRVQIQNIMAKPLPAFATLYRTASVNSYISPSATFEFYVDNVTGFMTYLGAPGAKIKIRNCEISGIKSYVTTGSQQVITVTDSDMVNTLASQGGSTIGEFGDASSEMIINGMTVRNQADLSFADAMQGVLIKTGVTCTLPSTVTAAIAFTGYKNTVFQ